MKRWLYPNARQLRFEADCYSGMIAPPGVAPCTKRPFSLPSELTCHFWVNFSKVFGKFLFAQIFSGVELEFLCEILDLLKLCLVAEISIERMSMVKELARKVSLKSKDLLPPTENSNVLHMLLFHMPDTLQYWGPARGYWCFPFER